MSVESGSTQESERASSDSQTAAVALKDFVALAVEHWRVSNALKHAAGPEANVARYALRTIGDILARWGVEAVSLDDKPFEPGLAATVVDTVMDPRVAPGQQIVQETISPMVLRHGKVIQVAQIVVGTEFKVR